MSVYKRPGAKTFTYDFWIDNHRFSGDSGKTSEREAKQWVKAFRVEAAAQAAARARLNAPQTWSDAASRYWNEVGKHHRNADVTAMNLDWLQREIGASTPLHAINDNIVSQLVAKRRAEFRKVGNADTPKRQVSAATVNRTMTEQLRKVWHRAKDVWRVPVGDVAWAQHMLPEPQERVREASAGEERKIMARLGRGYDEAVAFAFLSGCRRMEIVGLRKTDVDFFSRQFTVTGKGGKERLIPMSDELYDLLWRLKDTPTKHVFTFVAARTDERKKLVRGEHYPMTDAGLRTAMTRATKAGGVENFRFHDVRHTTATRALRNSNLKVVQKLLGHSDIATTTKYAHVMKEDVRAALNAMRPTKSPTTTAPEDAKLLSEKGK